MKGRKRKKDGGNTNTGYSDHLLLHGFFFSGQNITTPLSHLRVCLCTLHAHSRTLIYTSTRKHHEQCFALSFPRHVLNHLSHRWYSFLYSGTPNSLHISMRCVDLCSFLLLTFVTMLAKSHLQFTFLNINTWVSQFRYTHSCLLHHDNPCDT